MLRFIRRLFKKEGPKFWNGSIVGPTNVDFDPVNESERAFANLPPSPAKESIEPYITDEWAERGTDGQVESLS